MFTVNFPLVIQAVQDPASGTTKTRVPYRIHTYPGVTTAPTRSGLWLVADRANSDRE